MPTSAIWLTIVGIVFLVAIPVVILLLRATNRQEFDKPEIVPESEADQDRMALTSMAEFPNLKKPPLDQPPRKSA